MMLLLFTLACGAGTVALGPSDTSSDTGSENTGDTDQEGPSTSPWEGVYEGDVGTWVPEWEWEFCEGDLELVVDEDGLIDGDGTCYYASDWGDYEYDIQVEGEIDEDGELSGTISFETWEEVVESDLRGQADDDTIEGGWDFEMYFGGGGGGSEQEVEGWFELDR
ncbi:MAG: hypothetical protein GY913_36070 [Proteobacteria bacterium]|nr:hypothetical protein [Pseudomonadota bacterium]MCP4922348.1 hypothetical protein [Pseudomonadota bacterium]